MTKKKTDTPGVSPLLDSSGNPDFVAPGELIESAWGNSVVDRVIPRFPTFADLTAALAPSPGRLAGTLDTNTMWIGDGTNWRPTPIGQRLGFYGAGIAGGQPAPSGGPIIASWTMNDPFHITDGAQALTVPAGYNGRWYFEWSVEFSANGTGSRQVWCEATPGRRGSVAIESTATVPQRLSGSGTAMLTQGQSAYIAMLQTAPGTATCNPSGSQYFLGYFLGPY